MVYGLWLPEENLKHTQNPPRKLKNRSPDPYSCEAEEWIDAVPGLDRFRVCFELKA